MPLSRPMPAATRNKRITVMRLKSSATPNAAGQIDESDPTNWEIAKDVGNNGELWVGLTPRGSREFFRGEQVAADVTHQVNCLYPPAKTITTKMRFAFSGRILNISEPPRNIDENNHSLVFACIEVKEGR